MKPRNYLALAKERDRIMDSWLRLNPGDASRRELAEYLLDGAHKALMPRGLVQAQEALLKELAKINGGGLNA